MASELDADLLAREIVESESKSESKDPSQAAEDKVEVEVNRDRLANVKKDISKLGLPIFP